MPLPSLLKPEPERRCSKYFKVSVGLLITVLVLAGLYWFLFRFHSEDATVSAFMNRVVAGDFQDAYKMWHTGTSYDYTDFLQDWGTSGYYGPVHSFDIVDTHEPSDASGVIIVVDLSPFRRFPSDSNSAQAQQTKEVRLWVQFSDHSISYAP
jgi:hypothetical protein